MDITRAEIKLSDAVRNLILASSPPNNEHADKWHIDEAIKCMARAADLLGYALIPKRGV